MSLRNVVFQILNFTPLTATKFTVAIPLPRFLHQTASLRADNFNWRNIQNRTFANEEEKRKFLSRLVLRIQTAIDKRTGIEKISKKLGLPIDVRPTSRLTLRLKCPVAGCPTLCATKESLNEHLQKKHDIEKFRCLVRGCSDVSFSHWRDMHKHMTTVHGDQTTWPCDKCDFETANSYRALFVHHYTHHEAGQFACTVDGCDFTCETRREFSIHSKEHTAKYLCIECGKECRSKQALIEHRRMHTNERPYVCSETDCGKSFRLKAQLAAHIRVHRGEKIARCTWPGCFYSATKTHHIYRHIRLRHFGVPETRKERVAMNIPERDPREFVQRLMPDSQVSPDNCETDSEEA